MIRVLDLLTRWKDYLLGSLGIVVVVLSISLYINHLRLTAEVATRKADKARYEQIQQEASDKYRAYKADKEHEYRVKADEADQSYSSLSTKYHAALLQYAASKAKGGRPVERPTPVSNTEGGAGPSPSPDVSEVTISVEDASICADNTARLEVVHDWALKLK